MTFTRNYADVFSPFIDSLLHSSSTEDVLMSLQNTQTLFIISLDQIKTESGAYYWLIVTSVWCTSCVYACFFVGCRHVQQSELYPTPEDLLHTTKFCM